LCGYFEFLWRKRSRGSEARGGEAKLPVISTPSSTANSPVSPAGYPAAPIIANAKLNPAHGQPGHRCDIAVGAALPAEGSAPNLKLPTPTVPVLNTPIQNTTPVVQPPAATATCGIWFKPCTRTTWSSLRYSGWATIKFKPQPTNQTATAATPAQTAPLKPDTLFARGLNPAHGQPGHRCDIAVGQPLNSTPKKS
jgi:hypothetical protein